jgi:hypothetical protein
MILQRKQKQVVHNAIERRMQMVQVSGGKKRVVGGTPLEVESPAKLFLVKAGATTSPYTSYVAYLPEEPETAKLWPEGLQMGTQIARGRVLEMQPRVAERSSWLSALKSLLSPAEWAGHPMFAWLRTV